MDNTEKEKHLDNALLAQFDLDPHLKITTSLTMAIHRQLMTLSDNTGISINDMDREFILENLAKVTVTSSIRAKAGLA
ncbi:hypothetical protein N9060_02005 [Arenicella sp.]|nr:hypothetical protein [Arenicella sp.]